MAHSYPSSFEMVDAVTREFVSKFMWKCTNPSPNQSLNFLNIIEKICVYDLPGDGTNAPIFRDQIRYNFYGYAKDLYLEFRNLMIERCYKGQHIVPTPDQLSMVANYALEYACRILTVSAYLFHKEPESASNDQKNCKHKSFAEYQVNQMFALINKSQPSTSRNWLRINIDENYLDNFVNELRTVMAEIY